MVCRLFEVTRKSFSDRHLQNNACLKTNSRQMGNTIKNQFHTNHFLPTEYTFSESTLKQNRPHNDCNLHCNLWRKEYLVEITYRLDFIRFSLAFAACAYLYSSTHCPYRWRAFWHDCIGLGVYELRRYIGLRHRSRPYSSCFPPSRAKKHTKRTCRICYRLPYYLSGGPNR